MVRKATAVWNGNLKEGNGVLSSDSGTLKETPYSFRFRFGDGIGLNPEELIASAHAGCFAMATSAQLEERGIVADSIEASAAVTMEGLALTSSKLTVKITAPGADVAKVEEAAKAAEAGCPISKVLNLEISMDLEVVA